MYLRWIFLGTLWLGNNLYAASVLKVVSTFSVLSDLISQVGGDTIEIQTLVPCNVDPHTYEPTPADSIACNQSNLIFVNGLTFEGWIERLVKASGYQGKIIKVSANIQPRHLTTQGEPAIDPHAWHNVQNAISYVKVIAQALKEALPSSKHAVVDHRTTEFLKKLQALDQWVHNQFNSIPYHKRQVVTTHDAFWYYGDAYHVTFLSPVGLSTEDQPAAGKLVELIKTIQAQQIKAVFIESLANPKLVEQIARETNLVIDGLLYADSLSEKDGPADSYISMIQYNTLQIVNALKA